MKPILVLLAAVQDTKGVSEAAIKNPQRDCGDSVQGSAQCASQTHVTERLRHAANR